MPYITEQNRLLFHNSEIRKWKWWVGVPHIVLAKSLELVKEVALYLWHIG